MKKQIVAYLVAYLVAALLALAFSPMPTKGNARTGSLSGKVTDPSGAVVPRATIFISGDRQLKTFATDETGHFLASGLTPGTYEISISSNGFAPFDMAGLPVTAGRGEVIHATLLLAVLKQSFTVSTDVSRHPSVAVGVQFLGYLRWTALMRRAQRLCGVIPMRGGNRITQG